jgi:phage terminase Nu1 subunit (DNA packaging protein)
MDSDSGMSQREYAKRRGVSHVAVQRAINSGRLKDSVQDRRIIDPDLADREWDANTDQTWKPTDGSPDMAAASAKEKFWKANLAELKYREAAGELLPAAEVRAEVEAVFAECKNKLLGIPSRVKQQDPTITAAQLIRLEELIRESLEALSRGL